MSSTRPQQRQESVKADEVALGTDVFAFQGYKVEFGPNTSVAIGKAHAPQTFSTIGNPTAANQRDLVERSRRDLRLQCRAPSEVSAEEESEGRRRCKPCMSPTPALNAMLHCCLNGWDDFVWDHFGIMLGSFWDHFGVMLGSFWDHFGIMLGSSWDHFGIMLGSFWINVGIILGSF